MQIGSVLTVFYDTFQARHLLNINIKEYDRDDCRELIITSGSTWKIVYACERLA